MRDEEFPVIGDYFPNYRVHTVPNGGHWPHAEAPFPMNCKMAVHLRRCVTGNRRPFARRLTKIRSPTIYLVA